MKSRQRGVRDLLSVATIVGLLAAATLLPPDTSLRVLRQRGVLRVCVPTSYPPLVIAGSAQPGIDVELVTAIASELGVRLQLVANPSIGADYNPRNWRITRSQCEMVAGGVLATDLTRSFLETTPPHLSTGWAVVSSGTQTTLADRPVAFAPGATGLDRIALSHYFRSIGAEVRTLPDLTALEAALLDGSVAFGVSEGLAARVVAGRHGWSVAYLPDPLAPAPVALGLWKGDLTLLRAVRAILARMRSRGELEALVNEYELAPIASECVVCPPP